MISESAYGFSIVEIVRENPKKKTIHFGGIKGQAIRECYMEMTYDTMYEESNIKSLPPFMDNRHPHPSTHLYASKMPAFSQYRPCYDDSCRL